MNERQQRVAKYFHIYTPMKTISHFPAKISSANGKADIQR
jgi:hypothetical protein